MNLVGLTINAAQRHGGFSYSHPPTGFVFEIRTDDSDSEEEEPCLIFNPLSFGSAENVSLNYLLVHSLPSQIVLLGYSFPLQNVCTLLHVGTWAGSKCCICKFVE